MEHDKFYNLRSLIHINSTIPTNEHALKNESNKVILIDRDPRKKIRDRQKRKNKKGKGFLDYLTPLQYLMLTILNVKS